jgi:molecular chaperone DnaJ
VAVQADWLEKDLYAVLGVANDADSKTISRAYRKLARQLHPDTHPDDADAAERFKEVTAAYDVIGDATKRAEYDEFRRAVADARPGPGEGPAWSRDGASWSADRSPWGRGDGAWSQGEGAVWSRTDAGNWTRFETGDFPGEASGWATADGENIDDLLAGLFGTSEHRGAAVRRGVDLEATLDLDFVDAVRGLTTEVTLSGPDGSQNFKVRVPAGVNDGQRIRLTGKGGLGANGGAPGDLYVVVRVGPHPVFGRRGEHLTIDAPITWPQAVLGTDIPIPTLDGPTVRVRVPAGTPHGRTLRVRGHGVRTPKSTGDLLVTIRITVPEQLTDEQRQAVQAVSDAFAVA